MNQKFKIILSLLVLSVPAFLYTNCDQTEFSGLGSGSTVFNDLPDTPQCNSMSQSQQAIIAASKSFIPTSSGLITAASITKPQDISKNAIITIDNDCVKSFKDSLGKDSRMLKKLSKKLRKQSLEINFSKAELKEVRMFNSLRELGCVKAVGENHEYQTSSLSSTFNDSLADSQHYLDSISYTPGYEGFLNSSAGLNNTDKKIIIAVIDTGSTPEHNELSGQFWQSPDGYNGVNIPEISTSSEHDVSDVSPRYHGTHISGIVGAIQDNAQGITGMGGVAIEVMVVKVFRSDGEGGTTASSSDVINGINWAVDNGANVINLSLSKEVSGFGTDQLFEQSIVDAVNDGVFVTVAAGNSASSGKKITDNNFGVVPARYGKYYDGVVAVGSYDVDSGQKSNFSHYSNEHVEIAAPGAQSSSAGILSLKSTNSYGDLSGTSQASPMVASSAALFIGLFQKYYGELPTPAMVETAILTSATKSSALAPYFKDGNSLNVEGLFNYTVSNYAKIGEAYGVDSSDLCF